MKLSIEIADTHTVHLRTGESITLDVRDIPESVWVKVVELGLGTKRRNFAASALMNCKIRAAGPKANDETEKAYENRLDSMIIGTETLSAEQVACIKTGDARLGKGDWGAERGTGSGEPAMDMAPITYAMAVYAPKLAADIPGWADMKVTERRKAVNGWLDAKPGRRDTINKKVAEEKAAAMDI